MVQKNLAARLPVLYREACRCWGIEPDPKVLAYSTTYETVRADLKELTGSAQGAKAML